MNDQASRPVWMEWMCKGQVAWRGVAWHGAAAEGREDTGEG